MLSHLFKLIWNNKKHNFLLIIEMLVSFLVIFAVSSMMVYYYHNYKQPMGFEYEDVWVVNYSKPEKIQRNDSVMLFSQTIKQMLKSMPQIKEISFAGSNVPFAASTYNSNIDYNGKAILSNIYDAELGYYNVLDMHVKEGRWFNTSDKVANIQPVVINENLKTTLFGNEHAIGKILGSDANRMKVVGVVQNLKDKGSYQPIEAGFYKLMDSGSYRNASTLLLKMQPGTDAAFEGKLFKSLSNAIGSSIEIEHLNKKITEKNRLFLVPAIIATIVAGFLIINVALGLFGVLWYNINKRKSEIGLRRAVGATGYSVSKQLVGEALVLSTFALTIGSFFTVQFPLLNVFDLPSGVYITAMVLSIVFIYLLVIICALYPGKQAAAIYPATALHED